MNGIKRGETADEEAITSGAAEANIGDLFWHMNLSDDIASGRDALDAVSGACPDVAINVGTKAVRNAGRHIGENAAIAETVPYDVKRTDVMRGLWIRPEAGIAMYRIDSSGEKARPFGREKSSTSRPPE